MDWRYSDERRVVAGRLFDTFGPSLYRYALVLLGEPEAAEDAIQQVFTAILRSGRPIDDEVRYLRRAVRNECYSTLRRRKTYTMVQSPLIEPIVAERTSPEERLALESAMRALPPEQREVILLHVFEGASFREIGDLLNEPVNTVAARYRYALAKLRHILQPKAERVANEGF